MANLFVNLPLPVLNGPGAGVATGGMGRDKTIVVSGTFPGATITVEVSVDGGVNFAPIAVFQSGSNKKVIPVAAQWMRVNVSGRSPLIAFSANIDVGANDNGALFMAIPLPAFNGAGASVSAASLGSFTTFVVAGTFPGAAIQIQASEDGVDWAPCVQFSGGGGIQSKDTIADFYRTFVSGRTSGAPFAATVAVGSIQDPITTAQPPNPITNFTYLEDFINTGGFNSKPSAGGTSLLVGNPSNNNYYVGVVNLQAVAPGDEIEINVLFDTASSPISGKATLSFGDGQIVVEARGNLGVVPTAIDDGNIDLMGTLGFALGPGLLGNQNWWTSGPVFVDTGVLATTAITKFRTEYDSVTDIATWYIDGVLVHTQPAVFGGTGSYSINAHVENISNNTGSLFFLIDYIYVTSTTNR